MIKQTKGFKKYLPPAGIVHQFTTFRKTKQQKLLPERNETIQYLIRSKTNFCVMTLECVENSASQVSKDRPTDLLDHSDVASYKCV